MTQVAVAKAAGNDVSNIKPQFAKTGKEHITEGMQEILYILIGLAFLNFTGLFVRTYCLSSLGENVTEKLRILLYESVLQKNMGWFDDRSNATSVITTRMSEDTQRLNDVSTNSLSPILTGLANLAAGYVICTYFSWKLALISVVIVPPMLVAQFYGIRIMNGALRVSSEMMKEANLLLGDAIQNYKTV